MSLKKCLITQDGQAVVEYMVIFLLLVVTIIIVFGGFNLGDQSGDNSNLGIKTAFDQAVNNAINRINR